MKLSLTRLSFCNFYGSDTKRPLVTLSVYVCVGKGEGESTIERSAHLTFMHHTFNPTLTQPASGSEYILYIIGFLLFNIKW